MRIVAILFLLVIVFALSSFKKDEQPSPPRHTYVNGDMKSKFVFNTGTYWIYENEVGVKDCVVVTSLSHGTNHYTCGSMCGMESYNEYYLMNLQSTLPNNINNYFFIGDNMYYNCGWVDGLYGNLAYIHNQPVGTSQIGLTIASKYDSISVGGGMFYDVTQTFQSQDIYHTNFYFAEWGGLVRKEYNDMSGAHVWNLKDFHIVP